MLPHPAEVVFAEDKDRGSYQPPEPHYELHPRRLMQALGVRGSMSRYQPTCACRKLGAAAIGAKLNREVVVIAFRA